MPFVTPLDLLLCSSHKPLPYLLYLKSIICKDVTVVQTGLVGVCRGMTMTHGQSEKMHALFVLCPAVMFLLSCIVIIAAKLCLFPLPVFHLRYTIIHLGIRFLDLKKEVCCGTYSACGTHAGLIERMVTLQCES